MNVESGDGEVNSVPEEHIHGTNEPSSVSLSLGLFI